MTEPTPKRYFIEREQVVFGDRFLNETAIGRRAAVRLGPYKTWQEAKDAMRAMRAQGERGGRVVSD